MSKVSAFLGELHRRSIWQIAGSYAVGSWLVLQLAETLSSLLGLPLWFGPAVIGLLALGLPIVLLTSVIQGRRHREPVASGEGSDPTADAGGMERGAEDSEGSAGATALFTWRNTLTGAGLVALLLSLATGGYLGMRQLGMGPVGTLQAKGVIELDERLILADFENRTSDPSLGETVTALFRIDLTQSDAVRIMEPLQLAPVLQRMERAPDAKVDLDVAREIAQREGIKAIVTGEVLALGDGVVISLRLVSVADGEALVADRVTVPDVVNVPEAIDGLSAKLRERIGESLRTIQGDPPLADVTTASLQALEKYAQAERANNLGESERAIALLEEALASDSTFAMANRKLGIILTNINRDTERASQAFTRAYERRDRLTERERYLAEAAYFTYVESDPAAAVRAYESLLGRYPNDAIALNNLAVAYRNDGRNEEAVTMYRRAVDSGNAATSSYTNAVILLFGLGRAADAEAMLARLSADHPGNPGILRQGTALAAARFDFARAEALAQELLEVSRGNPIWEVQALLDLSAVAFTRGRLAESFDFLFRGFDLAKRLEMGFIPQPRHIFEAQVLAAAAIDLSGDTTGGLRLLDEATRGAGWDTLAAEDRNHLGFALLYGTARQPEEATRLIQLFDEQVGLETLLPGAASPLPAVEATVAYAEGRWEDAISLFRQASDEVLCPLCGVREMGEVFLAGGQPDSAVVVFQRYLDTPVLFRSAMDGGSLWRVLLGLGEAHEQLGDRAAAAAAYRRLVEMWADADAELQPRVAEARARLTALEQGGG